MDLLTINETATMFNAEARSSIILISTKKIRQLDKENLAAFFRG